MVRRRRMERAQYWRGVIRDQKASGLSISAFCKEREVPASSPVLEPPQVSAGAGATGLSRERTHRACWGETSLASGTSK